MTTRRTDSLAITSERNANGYLRVAVAAGAQDARELYLTTAQAAALVALLLADGAVHHAWLHGGGR